MTLAGDIGIAPPPAWFCPWCGADLPDPNHPNHTETPMSMSTHQGRAAFRDGPISINTTTGPAHASKVLMGVYPKGGSYTLEEVGNEVHVFRSPEVAPRTNDTGPGSAASMQAANRARWR